MLRSSLDLLPLPGRMEIRRPLLSRGFSRWPALVGVFLIWVTTADLEAQLPAARVLSVFPPGGARGKTTDVVIRGSDLDGTHSLHFSHPGISATQVMNPPGQFEKAPTPQRDRFRVAVADGVPPGLYELRAVGKYGISNPRVFVVGDLEEVIEKEPNDARDKTQAVQLDSTVSGSVSRATDVDTYKVSLKKGQRIIVDCWAERIDSRLDAALVLFDAAGLELDRNHRSHRNDALIDFTAPADGDYLVQVYDFLYRGSSEYFYRLSFRTGPYIDFVSPPVGRPGTRSEFKVYGRNLPGGKPAPGVTVEGKQLEVLSVRISLPSEEDARDLRLASLVEPPTSGLDGFEYRLRHSSGLSNPSLITFSKERVILEEEPNDRAASAQKITVPCEFVGQFNPRLDEDWVEFEASKGDVYWIEVISERLGLPTDPQLLVQHVKRDSSGKETSRELKFVDDTSENIGGIDYNTASDDPRYQLSVPETGTYRVSVRDLFGDTQGDPRHLYRLAIRRAEPDFRLVALPRPPRVDKNRNNNKPNVWTPLIRRGGTERIELMAFRRDGFADPIDITVDGLPSGVHWRAAKIGRGQNSTTLVLSAAEDAPAWAGLIRIVGRATSNGRQLVRQARPATTVWPGIQDQTAPRVRLSQNIAVAVSSDELAPYRVYLGTSDTVEIARAGKIKVPVYVKRRGDFTGKVEVALRGLPSNVKVKNLTLDSKVEKAELELDVQKGAPLGTYTIYLETRSEVNYRRNPEAVAAATERRKVLEKVVADLSSAVEKSKAEATAKTTTIGDLETKAKELKEQAALLLKSAEEAAAALKIAREEKEKADKSTKDLESQVAAAKKAQEAAAKRAKDAENAAKPKKTKVEFPSTPLDLIITPAPLRLLVPRATMAVRQGTAVEIAINVARLYGYKGAVQLEATLPGGVKGVAPVKVTVPEGKTMGVLRFEASPDATTGAQRCTVKAKVKWNGQNLEVSKTFSLEVEASVPANKEF